MEIRTSSNLTITLKISNGKIGKKIHSINKMPTAHPINVDEMLVKKVERMLS